jgi:hypothetical protein
MILLQMKISGTFLCLFFYLLFSFQTNAQDALKTSTPKKEGSVEISRDGRVDSLVQKHIRINEQKQSIPGYRIQIYFGSLRTKAGEVKSDFLKKYPEVGAYNRYDPPNFKVRVGDFQTRLEALKFQKQLHTEFPAAFIVKDDISLPPIE